MAPFLSMMALGALARISPPLRPQLFGYEIWMPATPTDLFDFSAQLAQKQAALACHAETFGTSDLGAGLLGLNRCRAVCTLR